VGSKLALDTATASAEGRRREVADVVVVGGGPSGLTVAAELALAGVDVIVIERRTSLVQSRAGTVLPRVLELLDSRGLAHKFIERARQIRPNPLFTSHIWAGMQPVHWHHLGSRFGFRLIMPQNVTEDLLLEHARAVGVNIRHGASMTAITQDADGVSIDGEDADGAFTIEARYAVGADGGRSATRNALGIKSDGHDATFTGIVADVKFDFPWAGGRRMIDNEHGWAASFPFSETEAVTRFNMVHAGRRSTSTDEPVTEEEVRGCLRDIFGEDVPFETLRWGSRFSDAMWIAQSFRKDRVILVGEASRIHYPASGVGMNFCIQDAFNLGWKLAAVVNGHAAPALLDSYETERRPVTEALLQSVASQCAVQFNFTPEGMAFKRMFRTHMLPMAEVNARIAHELNGLTFSYPKRDDDETLVGYRVPDVDLVTSAGEARMGELLRTQDFLLIDLTGDDHFGGMDFGSAPARCVSGVPVLTPPALSGLTCLLVRPDGYVAWASRDAPSPWAVGAALRRALATDVDAARESTAVKQSEGVGA
jgi:2-polyprenyl-6-methoxyphenol hydroxylase-like FAD-dependent oxidoreductase